MRPLIDEIHSCVIEHEYKVQLYHFGTGIRIDDMNSKITMHYRDYIAFFVEFQEYEAAFALLDEYIILKYCGSQYLESKTPRLMHVAAALLRIKSKL